MPEIGVTPRGAVVAEDVRHLQQWPRHDCRRLRARTLASGPLALRALRHAQPIERALDLGDQTRRHACVPRRCGKARMSEHCLDNANVGAALQQVRRKRMPKRVTTSPAF
jgi:hypothetical protein